MGNVHNGDLRVDFDCLLRLKFPGIKATTHVGLVYIKAIIKQEFLHLGDIRITNAGVAELKNVLLNNKLFDPFDKVLPDFAI